MQRRKLETRMLYAHTLCDLAGVEIFLNLGAPALEMLQAPHYLNPALAHTMRESQVIRSKISQILSLGQSFLQHRFSSLSIFY